MFPSEMKWLTLIDCRSNADMRAVADYLSVHSSARRSRTYSKYATHFLWQNATPHDCESTDPIHTLWRTSVCSSRKARRLHMLPQRFLGNFTTFFGSSSETANCQGVDTFFPASTRHFPGSSSRHFPKTTMRHCGAFSPSLRVGQSVPRTTPTIQQLLRGISRFLSGIKA